MGRDSAGRFGTGLGSFLLPSTVAQMAEVTGFSGAPTNIFMHNEASGSIVDELASLTLTNGGTPTYGVTAPELPGELGISWTDAQSAGFVGATDAVLDPTTNSFAFMLVVEFTAEHGGGGRYLLEKRVTEGYRLEYRSDEELRFLCNGGVGNQSITLNFDHNDAAIHTVLAYVDRDADLISLSSDLGALSGVITHGTDLDNAGIFELPNDSANAAAHVNYWWAYWQGSAAEGITDTHRGNLHTHLGLP